MKSLGKAPRKLVWCCEEPMQIHLPGFHLGFVNQPKPKLPKTRCPKCGKKFNPRVQDCGDGNCWHAYIPPHKKSVKQTRKR